MLPLLCRCGNTAPTSAPAQRKGRYVPGSAAHPAKMLRRSPPTPSPPTPAQATSSSTPCASIGTTLVEAIHLGRSALGVEY